MSRDLWKFPHVRPSLQCRLPIPHGCHLLCFSCLQVNCQINPIGQEGYFYLAPAHQFSNFYCFLSITPFSDKFFSLSFIQSCLCLEFFVVYTQRDSQFCALFCLLSSFHFIPFASPYLDPHSCCISLLFHFHFQSHLSGTNSPFSYFSLSQVIFLSYRLSLIPVLFSPSVRE